MLKIYCFVILFVFEVNCYVDLFLNANETKTLFGYPGSLFYLFNGEIRSNSIQHRLDIPDVKSKIEFNWKNTAPLQMPVEYEISLINTNSSSLIDYSININRSGQVPLDGDSFLLNLDCKTSNRSQEDLFFDLLFNITFKLKHSKSMDTSIDLQLITMPNLNLSIHYRKYCSKKTVNSTHLKTKKTSSSFTIAYFIFAILLGFTCLILLGCVYMYLSNKSKFKKSISVSINTSNHSKYESLNKRRADDSRRASNQFAKNPQMKKNRQINQSVNRSQQVVDDELNIYETVQDPPVPVKTLNKTRLLNLTTNTIQSTSVPNMSVMTTRKNSNQVELCARYRPEQVEIGSIKMEGTFSKILNGILKVNQLESSQTDLTSQSETEIRVMIKKINTNGSQEQIDCMLRESCMFRGLKHKNLSTVLGICMDLNGDNQVDQPMALFNNFEIGNLKMYLLNLKKKRKNYSKNNEKSNQPTVNSDLDEQPVISTQELLYLILQLLKGVNYLHSKHVVHRDVAARNCWLDTNFSLKISDFALSRDMFPQDYHCLADNENKPVFWMSFESLTNNVYNVRTDVWSCGVFVWECFTLASQPYEQVDPFEFMDYLATSEQNRLERPSNCPKELYDVYSKCWSETPTQRPSLKELFNATHKFYNTLNNYV